MTNPKSPPITRLAYRVPEVVKVTGIGRSTLYQHIADGILKARRLNGVTIIMAGDLDLYLASFEVIE